MVLLVWLACYGRCLGELHGFDWMGNADACCMDCGENEGEGGEDCPCEVCSLFESGGTLLPELMAVPPVPDFEAGWMPGTPSLAPLAVAAGHAAEAPQFCDTGPDCGPRYCEWMASTATPVRGPNGQA